jgi:DNA-binding response OmpR family regulator
MPTPATPLTVLVVDDDPVILKLLEVSLEMEGFAVLTARDGDEGVALTRERRPDVVVSDIMMPRRSGLDLVADLKADPETRDIPVLLLTAKAQSADVQAGLDAGADDYITKPFEPLDLVERVQRAHTKRATGSAPSPRPS